MKKNRTTQNCCNEQFPTSSLKIVQCKEARHFIAEAYVKTYDEAGNVVADAAMRDFQ
jgi:hypothetical protein